MNRSSPGVYHVTCRQGSCTVLSSTGSMTFASFRRISLLIAAALLLVLAHPASAGVDFGGFFSMGAGIQDNINAWHRHNAEAELMNQPTVCKWPKVMDPANITFATHDFGKRCTFDKPDINCGKAGNCEIKLYRGNICSFRCYYDELDESGRIKDPECRWVGSDTSHPCVILDCWASGQGKAVSEHRYSAGQTLTTPELKLECVAPGVWRLTGNHVEGKCCGWDDCFGIDDGSYSCPNEENGCSPVGHYDPNSGLMCYNGVWVPAAKFP